MSSNKYPELNKSAMSILESRYLRIKNDGTRETVEDMFRRTAKTIASGEKHFSKPEDEQMIEERAYSMMRSLRWLPNTPTLTNSGRPKGMLSACLVLGLGDSMSEIMDTIKAQAIAQSRGSGVGMDFSRIRERGSQIESTGMTAVGPIPIIKLMNFMMSEFIIQGGVRHGANLATLKCDHPDVIEFINFKHKDGSCKSFNVSVSITDKFMKAVENNEKWDLISRHDGSVVQRLNANDIMDAIVDMAWRTGDPGIIFLDTINKFNPTPQFGDIVTCNACSELPMLPNEACTLGHMNLIKYILDTQPCYTINDFVNSFDFDSFRSDIEVAVRFLDNIIEASHYPLPEIEQMHKKTNRKIGLGVMGFADMLIMFGVAYDSDLARSIADLISNTLTRQALTASSQLAEWRGSFGAFNESTLAKNWKSMRNASVTTIAPTGTTGIIAGVSTGIEPNPFFILKRNQAGMEMVDIHPLFNKMLSSLTKENRTDVETYFNKNGTLIGCPSLNEHTQNVFVQSNDISIEGHIGMQATYQANISSAISKTINMKNSATKDDVRKAYIMAWKSGCKGITVYRDGCRADQPLSSNVGSQIKVEAEKCPECEKTLIKIDGCSSCPGCGYSKCDWSPGMKKNGKTHTSETK